MSTTVEQVLARKGSRYFFVGPEDSVLRASERLVERNVGALLVLEDGALVGIISERDCVRRVIANQRDAATTFVREVMTPLPITVSPGETIDHCMTMMTNARFRHLPVVQGAIVLGVVTLGDAVHAVLNDQQHMIEDLECYINGTSISVHPPAS